MAINQQTQSVEIDNRDGAIPQEVPIIPMRDTVVFPNTLFPILVGREASLAAVNDALAGDNYVLLCMQKNPADEAPQPDQLYQTGTLAQVVQVLKLPNELLKVLVSGQTTCGIGEVTQSEPFIKARISTHESEEKIKPTGKLKALIRRTREMFEKYVTLNQDLPEEVLLGFDQDDHPEHLLYFMVSYIDLEIAEKQEFLEPKSLQSKFKRLLKMLTSELELIAVSSEINEKVQEEIQETQRKYYIQEQIKVLQEELNEEGGFSDPDLAKLKEQLDARELPQQARDKANEELERLKKTPQMSPEYGVSRNYLEWILAMPWSTYSDDILDIKKVEQALERDHFGLQKPKDRILEHIAVLNMVQKMKGQILCFSGPPGTGKTSLAKSIASAMGREMVRISLGGISDEAEIRGHRKTYIGSMPGRIIQAMKRAGTMNPIIILDEIDKLGHDYRGDPSSAVLEVLDPEQNYAFNDHYLDMDFDLSNVMFITTANVASNIQPALRDRMEIINLPGYLEHDKLEIAKQHLIPRQIKSHGLTAGKVKFKDDGIRNIIRKYTSEAGVRQLELQIASICRKVAKLMVEKEADGKSVTQVTINPKRVRELLGVEKYRDRALDREDQIGSINGLAWTSTGGTILKIDVSTMPGKNKFMLTGQLGNVMKESAQAALTYIRSNAAKFDIPDNYFENHELHIHIPEGAIPKDGPSAGIAMALVIISLLTDTPVRHTVAVTGEITLRGDVYAVGGLNEKLLAAQRNKIPDVLIPEDNIPDLDEIPAKVKEGLNIIGVRNIDDAVKQVFKTVPKKKRK